MEVNLDKIDEARSSSNDSGGAQDYEQLPRVKLTPEAAIGGTIVDVGFTGDTSAAQNIRGGDGYGGDFVFTIENPELVEGTLFEALGRDDAEDNLIRNIDGDYYPFEVDRYGGAPTRDFRVVPEDWEESSHVSETVKKLDGDYEPVGIEIYGTEFPGQPRESFDDALASFERIEVFVGGQAGRLMMQGLDACLGQSAYIDSDGNKTHGLIEFPREYGTDEWSPSDGPFPRATTQPILHSELEGEDVALYLHFGDIPTGDDDSDDDDSGGQYRKHYGDILLDDGEGGTVLTSGEHPLDPETDVREDSWVYLQFHEPDGGWGDDNSSSDSDEGGSDDNGGSFDFDELDESGADGDGGELTINDLDPDTAEFVTEAAGYASDAGSIDDAFADFESVVENAAENDEIGDYSVDELRTVIEAEMEG